MALVVKNLPDRRHKRHGFDPWVGKSPWSRKWQPIPYSCLGDSMDRATWGATVHEAADSVRHQ